MVFAAPLSATRLMIGDFSIVVKPHMRARRLTLRYSARQECFTVTTPQRANRQGIVTFLHAQRDWMHGQLARAAMRPALVPPGNVLILGQPCRIVHQDGAGVEVILDDNILTITCRAARLPRVIHRFLQQQALQHITQLAHAKAATAGVTFGTITLRDTTSRWGSCAHNGNLRFSWRLVMAPLATLDYLVAHEVAHLRHFNHGPDFWTLCRALSVDYTGGKHWLKINGAALQQVTL